MKWTEKLGLVLQFTLLCLVQPVHAASVHWKPGVVDYSAEGKDIKDVLRDFSSSQGLAARISPDVSGTVSGAFKLPPRRFLDTLSGSFGFVWYYDGEVLDIDPSSSMTSTLVKLDTASTASLQRTLEIEHVADERFPIVYDSVQGTALVSGPPRYVDLVTQIADRLDSNAVRRGSGSQVHVFPLRHAWAEDRAVSIDGQQVTLQGVAAVLNAIYHGSSGAKAGASGPSMTSGVGRATPLANIAGITGGGGPGSLGGAGAAAPLPPGMAAFAAGGAIQPSPALAAVMAPPPSAAGDTNHLSPDQGSLPVIIADQRTNSVIIRDDPDRMAQYGPLIERLDVKPQLIEIEAHIIEIDDSAMRQLGIDWSFQNNHLNVPGAAAGSQGTSSSTVLNNSGQGLMATISALEQNSTAKIDASPKVVTLNNIEAVMDNKSQFFVPVSGFTSADLYSISTGISLRVLPMVLDEDGHTRIKLDVAIQDGELSGQMVGNLPVIQSSNINTQAFIDEGQALLIAGYRADDDANGMTGVPGLSKIPLLGALFRTNSRQKSHMERLFLLSPRIIEP
jgi:type III secretion protein C